MPPGGGYHGALNHVVIHGLDVTMPLEVPRRSPDETIRVVLDDLTEGGGHAHFGTGIEGRSLQATGVRCWATSQGSRVRVSHVWDWAVMVSAVLGRGSQTRRRSHPLGIDICWSVENAWSAPTSPVQGAAGGAWSEQKEAVW